MYVRASQSQYVLQSPLCVTHLIFSLISFFNYFVLNLSLIFSLVDESDKGLITLTDIPIGRWTMQEVSEICIEEDREKGKNRERERERERCRERERERESERDNTSDAVAITPRHVPASPADGSVCVCVCEAHDTRLAGVVVAARGGRDGGGGTDRRGQRGRR